MWSKYVDFPQSVIATGEAPLVFCPLPDHDNNRTPAFQISFDEPVCYCFGCGEGGSYLKIISQIEGVSEKEATKIIFGHSRIASKEDIKFVPKKIKNEVKELEENLSDYSYFPKEAIEYLESRDITPASRTRWQLGFDESVKRITIPVFDGRDRLRHIIRRSIYSYQNPKYLYSKESRKTECLFGVCNLDMEKVHSEGLILAEGSLDVIKLHQYGYRNAVGILGSALSIEQRNEITRLNPKCLYMCFDADLAGVHALETALHLRSKYPVKIILYPSGISDPAELSEEQIKKAIDNAIPFIHFVKRLKDKGIDKKTIDQLLGKKEEKWQNHQSS